MPAEHPPPPPLPLQRPPGYRDPNAPTQNRPPQKAVKLPPSFNPTKRRRASCCRSFCCCFCIVNIILIFVFVSAGFAFYLWFKPRLPEIQLKSIRFYKLNVTTTRDGPVLDAASTATVEIKNPNRDLGIVYGGSHVLLRSVDGGFSFGEQRVGGFIQDKKNVTRLKIGLKVEKEIVDGKSGEELKKGFQNSNLGLNGEIRSGIGVKISRWATNPVQVAVHCDGLILSQLQSGGSVPKCRIKLLNWVFIN